MKLFKDLNENQENEFRQWARENYQPLTPIEGIWHPVIQDECARINAAHDLLLGYPQDAGDSRDLHRPLTDEAFNPEGRPESEPAEKPERIQCPWCSKGWLEPTPPEYKDPAAVIYCACCSSVFKITALPELSP